MDKKYPKHIIDYAIDNKVSLEDAYNHYILNGKQEEKREEEQLKPEKPKDFSIEEEEKFLSELEQKIKADTDDEQWWAEWQDKMKKIEEMERELGVERDDVITKEEFDWVDAQLEECDKLYEEMYRKDL
tara:strand:+ start:395 stop:781 length:387 start_codon:yes stop_codon:yes gene_type:complete